MKKFATRTLALILSVVMVIGMLTLGASAAEADAAMFTDIAGSPYAEAIEALAKAGIVSGVGHGLYAPDRPVIRAMAVAILGNMAAGQQEYDGRFVDVSSKAWYAGYVGWAVENLDVVGVGNDRFEPDRGITGHDMDVLLSRYAELAGVEHTAANDSREPLTRGEMAEMVYDVYQQITVRKTAYGDVQGYIDTSNGTLAWLGVPYGTAGRWEAPAEKTWDGVKECTETGPMAIQPNQAAASSGGDPTDGEPDCLNLDIYAPAGAENKPVLVFLHGGNNQTGSAVSEFTGEELVDNLDCVFVSLNFRIGPLGFNPLPALKTGEDELLDSGNYGMLDIAFALEWVKENIAEFGGDPDNITISGNSAGGRNVMAMLISPIFDGLFDKALVSSGGMTVADEEDSAIQFAYYLSDLAIQDGKAETTEEAIEYLMTDSEEVAEYLKGLSDVDLIDCFDPNAGIRMALSPHLFNDGCVLPEEGFATTEYYPVPVMMLAGVNEFSFFGSVGPDNFFSSDEYNALDAETQAAASEFNRKYGSDMYRIFNGQVSADTMYPYYGDTPIYVAQFNYGGLDSGHCSWFKFCMNSTQNATGASFTTEGGWQVYNWFNTYVKNFLHSEDGDPNGEGLTEWTAWDPDTQLSMVFDSNEDMTAATAEMKNVATTYEEIIKAMEEDTTVSEEIKWQIIDTCISGRWFSYAQDTHFGARSFWYADLMTE